MARSNALDDERLVIAIGDVSGKGVPAALFMAVTRSFLRSGFRVEDDPAKVLARVNEDLAEGNDSCMFVTIFCAVVHLSEGLVEYANAGHNPPLLLDPQGQVEWIDAVHGPAAGAWPGSDYTTGRFRLPVGRCSCSIPTASPRPWTPPTPCSARTGWPSG